MYPSKVRTYLACVVIFSVICAQIIPALADSKKVRVAFAGVKFEDLPEDIEKRIFDRLKNQLSRSSLELINPSDVQAAIGSEKMEAFFDKLDHASFSALAEKLQVDYVFAGHIGNNSRDPERILLVGDLFRYDRVSNLKHRFEILKYYDNIGVELLKFRQEFVRTIEPEEQVKSKFAPYLLLAGIAAVGIATFAFVKVSTKNEGQPGQRPPDTP
ncbi:MAG: hypothetical protein ACE5IR_14125 [bacterium]